MKIMKRGIICFLACLSLLVTVVAAGSGCARLRERQTPSPTSPTAPTTTPATTNSGAKNKQIRSIKTLVENGGRVSWSFDGSLIAFDRQESDGYNDVLTMNPDGSGQKCLTCNKPKLAGHNGNAEWHPSGEYLVFQAQDIGLTLPPVSQGLQNYATSPGIGINNNLWVMTSNSDTFWQLTFTESGRGTLHPHFSNKGDKLAWSEVALSGEGTQVMKLADFSIVDGKPQLDNIRTLAPKNLYWYETHGFSPDDSKIIFCGYPNGCYFFDLEIYTLDLKTDELIGLTDDDEWDEHAHFFPDGRKIIWSSSAGVSQTKASNNQELLQNPTQLELWTMNPDGSGKQRLTYVNDPSAPEYVNSPIGAGLGDGSWSPDGKKYVAKLRPGRGNEMVVLIEFDN